MFILFAIHFNQLFRWRDDAVSLDGRITENNNDKSMKDDENAGKFFGIAGWLAHKP